jgi:ABC-2 type transport system permease protein
MRLAMNVPLLDKIAAVLRRDFLTAARYRAALFIAVASAVLEIAGLYYLSKAIGPAFRPDGMDSYPFLLVGTGLYTFLLMGISSFLSAIQQAQQAGTLEVLMTTSTDPSVLLLLSAISSFAGNGFTFLVYLLGGLVISGARLGPASFFPACLVLAFSVAIAIALGVGAAAVQLAVQKGSAIVWLLGSAVWLLTGAMFPISALPPWLRNVAMFIPMTHALNAMRMALFNGGFSAPLLREIVTLAAFAVLLLPVSLLLFAETLRRARLNGTLSYS